MNTGNESRSNEYGQNRGGAKSVPQEELLDLILSEQLLFFL